MRDVELLYALLTAAGSHSLVEQLRGGMKSIGLAQAVQERRSEIILDWMLEVVSYQGISDTVAANYLEEHGGVTAAALASGAARSRCRKLTSYWAFDGCGYQKAARTCGEPRNFVTCSLPRHDLRNGRLNQTSYAFFLFFRDVADGDIVGWIDTQLDRASRCVANGQAERWRLLRQSLLVPLSHVFGVGDKVLSMALSDLLLGAGVADRPLWRETGAAMIAVDSLVHNWLHRTGVAHRWGLPHVYGPRCYSPDGCADVIERLTMRIDASLFNDEFPSQFPRFVQKGIWSFCAATELDRCNGNRIDDAVGCEDPTCPLGSYCDRRAIAGRY